MADKEYLDKPGVKQMSESLLLINKARIANNLVTEDEGFALDARQGKALIAKLEILEEKITHMGGENWSDWIECDEQILGSSKAISVKMKYRYSDSKIELYADHYFLNRSQPKITNMSYFQFDNPISKVSLGNRSFAWKLYCGSMNSTVYVDAIYDGSVDKFTVIYSEMSTSATQLVDTSYVYGGSTVVNL